MAAAMLAAVQRRFDELASIFQRTARISIGEARLADYVRWVFPEPRRSHDDARYERAMRQVQDDRDAAAYFFDNGKNTEIRESRGLFGPPTTVWPNTLITNGSRRERLIAG